VIAIREDMMAELLVGNNGMTRREFLSGVFSKEQAKDLYKTWYGFDRELHKVKAPSGDKELLAFAEKLRNKSICGKEGKK